jgi:outer membrane protein TolC
MEDVSLLQSKITALQSENQSLKDTIEQLDAQCRAFDQTTVEVLKANISLKAGAALLENKENKMKSEIQALNVIIGELKSGHVEKYVKTEADESLTE